MASEITRIIGVGNPLMADDGLGIRAIELLQQQALPDQIELIDGGCGGLSLLPFLTDCKELFIIDAADFSAPPGSIKVLDQPDISQLSSSIQLATAHHFDLPEVLRAADKLKKLPPLSLFLMQVSSCAPRIQLSRNIEIALPELLKKIIDHL